MATVIPFEERAVAHLRERLGEAREANEDLIAFARGHSGAVASIHRPCSPRSRPRGAEQLLHVVTQEWPLILGIDAVALSLIIGDKGFRADGSGIQFVEPAIVRRSIKRGRRSRDEQGRARPCAVRPGLRPDPRPGADPHRIRTALSPRVAGARPARGPQPRRRPRLGTADVPRERACGYDPQVADAPAEPSHPAQALARAMGMPISSTTAAARRTPCVPTSRPRIA